MFNPSKRKKIIIGLLGPTGGGKTTLSGIFAERRLGDVEVLAWADSLRECAAEAGVWDGVKTPESRARLQQFSEDYKRIHGDDVFRKKALRRAMSSDKPVIVFEDTRFGAEIHDVCWGMGFGAPLGWNGMVLRMDEAEAEARWQAAIAQPICEDTKWAWHRSETEWRGMRHMFPGFVNDKHLEIGKAVNAFERLVDTFSTTTDFRVWFKNTNTGAISE